jgi:hypothetical protein
MQEQSWDIAGDPHHGGNIQWLELCAQPSPSQGRSGEEPSHSEGMTPSHWQGEPEYDVKSHFPIFKEIVTFPYLW